MFCESLVAQNRLEVLEDTLHILWNSALVHQCGQLYTSDADTTLTSLKQAHISTHA